MIAVTFDFGQTLAELDVDLLACRARARGVIVESDRLALASNAAWNAYGRAKHAGMEGREAWMTFMRTLLDGAGATGRTPTSLDDLVAFLWEEQPSMNLWRRPIAGMFELCRDLSCTGVPVGIVSNSEGRLEELVEELGQGASFAAVADSGRLGFEKPDPRIFGWAAGRLGVRCEEIVHVGDAWEADIEGAIAAGARAIWFTARPDRPLRDGVIACKDALEVRAALAAWGAPSFGNPHAPASRVD